jgi:cation:H+ antiporter
MIANTLCILLGLILLIFGGDRLTASASKFAAHFGVKPIVIGLTVVAFGTSMPEAFVSIFASATSKPGIAIGNVVGSNLFNIAFILGISSVIRPLSVESNSLKREIPFVVASSLLFWILSWDGALSRLDGAVLLLVFVFFLRSCFLNTAVKDAVIDGRKGKVSIEVSWMAGSLILLSFGASFLVKGSIGVAQALGVSELLIGLTVVAVGTSLPELATSVLASIKKKDDIAVGNVMGSNVFNILCILGVSAVIKPLTVNAEVLTRDIPALIFISLAVVPILKTGFVISRMEGLFLLLLYFGYMFWIVQ